jgi:SAM-dependent methyltransferase
MVSTANYNYWEQNYQEGTTRWDLGRAAPAFVSLLNAGTEVLKPGRAAVLGCGRGYDAIAFAARGFEVIGFDFAPSAIADAKALAEANYSSAQFLQRDIFDLAVEFPSDFDYVIEHTCFCAIPPEKRPAYVQLVRSLLKPAGEAIALFFTHTRPGGPPFGITTAEIRQYFETDFEVLSLEPVTNSVPERQGEEHLGRLRVKP